jgi:protein-S-isoprenylcysteine O-methyltransferase Ste14
MRAMTRGLSFAARGGWWVVAQVPALTLAVLLPPWTSPVQGPPDTPLQWVGLSVAVAGVVCAFAAAATLAFRSALTPYPQPSARARLAVGGIYGWARHPLYTGVLLTTLGWSLLWLSVVGIAYTLALAVFFDRKAAGEERRLRARFPSYAGYARRVRRFLPGIY